MHSEHACCANRTVEITKNEIGGWNTTKYPQTNEIIFNKSIQHTACNNLQTPKPQYLLQKRETKFFKFENKKSKGHQ